MFEDVIVQFDTMCFLSRGPLKLRQRGKDSPLRVLRFISGFSVFRCQPLVLRSYSAIRAKTVVVAAVVSRCVRPGHNASLWGIPAQKQVIAKMSVRVGIARGLFCNHRVLVCQD